MVLSTMNALVVEVPEVPENAKPELVKKEISPPMLEAHEVLVKVSTVAQNPTDGKILPRILTEFTVLNISQFKLSISICLETALSSAATLQEQPNV
jgi:hypothetical protein